MKYVRNESAILTEYVWKDSIGAPRTNITYSFNDEYKDYHRFLIDERMSESISKFSKFEKDAARKAFNIWSEGTVITFDEVNDDEADIQLTLFDFDLNPNLINTLGMAVYPGPGRSAGDIFIDQEYSLDIGLYLHEIGHSLGLDHSFEGSAVLHGSIDKRENTVMGQYDPDRANLGRLDILAINSMYADTIFHKERSNTKSLNENSGSQLRGDRNDNNLRGTHQADEIHARGGNDKVKAKNGDDFVLGGRGNDVIRGGVGQDTLKGGAGDDLIIGNNGADRLIGGTGEDTLAGGVGGDTLTGGTGMDWFVFSADQSDSRITDFELGKDSLILVDWGGSTEIDYQVNRYAMTLIYDQTFITLMGDFHDHVEEIDIIFQ